MPGLVIVSQSKPSITGVILWYLNCDHIQTLYGCYCVGDVYMLVVTLACLKREIIYEFSDLIKTDVLFPEINLVKLFTLLPSL